MFVWPILLPLVDHMVDIDHWWEIHINKFPLFDGESPAIDGSTNGGLLTAEPTINHHCWLLTPIMSR